MGITMKWNQNNKKPIYPFHEWEIIEETFDVETNLQDETIFSIGNGYLGMRANLEEGYSGPKETTVNGTYINGFYEAVPIIYGEEAYGYAKNSQTMVNVTDSKIIQLYLEREPFDLLTGKILHYKRTLQMKDGVLSRSVIWESPSGKQVEIKIRRIASFTRKHLAAIAFDVIPLNFDGEITIVSALNGAVENQGKKGDPRSGSGLSGQVLLTKETKVDGAFANIVQQTKHTKFGLVCSMENQLETENTYAMDSKAEKQWLEVRYRIAAKRNKKIQLSKYISYYTSLDLPKTDLPDAGKREVKEAKELGFKGLLQEQKKFMEAYWYHTDVVIDGDQAIQQSIRFNAFHLLQSIGRDGKTNIGAKGLTGEGYQGHYFWDTETYIFPFFLYTNPKISKKLLEYRYAILDHARARAKELSLKGALYPWRTINGEESSAYYPAGTAQYHINADIMYALKKYMHATDDIPFLLSTGAEMLFETARFWLDLGDFIQKKDGMRFVINGVTGPDEYTALVNNNVYTNLMAKDHLAYAVQTAAWIKEHHPEVYYLLLQKIDLQEKEIEDWQKAAELIYLPYDEDLAIYPQDDTFLDKAIWDFANTPADHYPLLLHYHPLIIYRYQVLKQADLVLALYLQGNHFTMAEKKRNYDYYEPITTHDSSLSPCIYSIVGAEIGYKEKAYQYFKQTARMDLDDINHNVKDGVHTAAMAGAWLSIFSGFAGIREYHGILSFKPYVPEPWNSYQFKVTFRGRLIHVHIAKDMVQYALLEGDPITIQHEYQTLLLEKEKEVKIRLNPKLEAVIFDLDGVLTDTAEYHYQAWKKIADQLGIPFDRTWNERLKGISRFQSLEQILAKSNKAYAEDEKRAIADQKNKYYQEMIQTITPDKLFSGISNLLEELKQNGIKIALASSSKNSLTVVNRLNISKYFDYIVNPATIKKGKPDPEIFMTAAEQLRVPYQNCIGIEDAAAGITAIKAANMYAVGVGDSNTLNEADWIVADTAELTLEQIENHFYRFSSK